MNRETHTCGFEEQHPSNSGLIPRGQDSNLPVRYRRLMFGPWNPSRTCSSSDAFATAHVQAAMLGEGWASQHPHYDRLSAEAWVWRLIQCRAFILAGARSWG